MPRERAGGRPSPASLRAASHRMYGAPGSGGALGGAPGLAYSYPSTAAPSLPAQGPATGYQVWERGSGQVPASVPATGGPPGGVGSARSGCTAAAPCNCREEADRRLQAQRAAIRRVEADVKDWLAAARRQADDANARADRAEAATKASSQQVCLTPARPQLDWLVACPEGVGFTLWLWLLLFLQVSLFHLCHYDCGALLSAFMAPPARPCNEDRTACGRRSSGRGPGSQRGGQRSGQKSQGGD